MSISRERLRDDCIEWGRHVCYEAISADLLDLRVLTSWRNLHIKRLCQCETCIDNVWMVLIRGENRPRCLFNDVRTYYLRAVGPQSPDDCLCVGYCQKRIVSGHDLMLHDAWVLSENTATQFVLRTTRCWYKIDLQGNA